MLEGIILILRHFSSVMLLLVILITLYNSLFYSSLSIEETLFRSTALFALGFTGIYTFIMHVFFPEISAATIGWTTNPFQFEVGIANLLTGVLGIISFKSDRGFRAGRGCRLIE